MYGIGLIIWTFISIGIYKNNLFFKIARKKSLSKNNQWNRKTNMWFHRIVVFDLVHFRPIVGLIVRRYKKSDFFIF